MEKQKMGVLRAAIGDAILTSIWVFIMSTLRIASTEVALFLSLQPLSLAGLFITTVLNTFCVLTVSFIGGVLGGASFNPSTTVSFYTAGLRPDSSLSSMAVRFPAQAFGGAVGAKALVLVMPSQYKHMLKGPFLKVDLHTGALAEGLLTFTHNMAILFLVLRGPKNPFLKVYLLSVATAALVIPGSGFTGPSMNPANAFGWAFVNNKHNTLEQFYVYWVCPFLGASSAAFIFRSLFMAPIKQKKA
ncbi:aquaporin SIP1-2-like [Vigna unguiculata]|uniref:Aquaporin SIP n=1 Tax=Vigna unguiculata TaxID=3917 RepID=A0A4D6LH13_VIGUN|nr:aquaporin SIP1-2-like [Vigna unguiculata]QCD87942.1 aquaporin SIP [Vigna unguiculata]